MRDPRTLRIDDRLRFVALPDEWNAPGHHVHAETRAFVQFLIARGRPSRVQKVDEFGYPWIEARLRDEDGFIHYHWYRIHEATGWRRVVPRPTT